MDFRPAGFVPGQRRDVSQFSRPDQRRETQPIQTRRQPTEVRHQEKRREQFNLKADRGYRDAKVLLSWLQRYQQDFARIQDMGKIYDWVQGTGERFSAVNPDLAEMVDEKMETLGIDDPRMAAKVLHQELYTRGSEHVQTLRRYPDLSIDDAEELETMYWNFEDQRPDQRKVA